MVTGWGRITNDLDTFTEDFTNNKAGSQALREVTVPIKSTEFCENVPEFGFNDLKFDKRFCAGGVEGNEQSHYIEVAQGGISSRAIHNRL